MKLMISKLMGKIRIYRHRRKILKAIDGGLNMGKNITIMDGVRFDPPHNALITIGDNVVIGHDVRIIAHDGSMFRRLAYGRMGCVDIKKNSFLGERCLILPGVTIGEDVFIGAGSVVSKDIPHNSIAIGNPVKIIGTLSDYLDSQNKKIKASTIFQFDEFYGNIRGKLNELKDEKSKKNFYTKGQYTKIRSAYRFNYSEND